MASNYDDMAILEIMNRNVSKWNAISILAKKLKIG